jgi:flavin reductase (DIM6/NTAB) family NADH-FMN oxidoreductase RutF
MSSAAISPELFRRACAQFPTGVTVVTTRAADGTPHGLTVNAFCSLSLNPPLVFVAIDRSSRLLDAFERCGRFAINFLSNDQRDLSVRFSQLPEGRFNGVSWYPGVEGLPLLQGALGYIECRLAQIVDVGDHRGLIGEVVGASAGAGDPLVYFRSMYTRLEPLSDVEN